ncbi:MAG: hypothetical protein HY673_13875 [Chloroflexi bacterium]|nr:hypothetical protein [Chloroflexota bacterium]
MATKIGRTIRTVGVVVAFILAVSSLYAALLGTFILPMVTVSDAIFALRTDSATAVVESVTVKGEPYRAHERYESGVLAEASVLYPVNGEPTRTTVSVPLDWPRLLLVPMGMSDFPTEGGTLDIRYYRADPSSARIFVGNRLLKDAIWLGACLLAWVFAISFIESQERKERGQSRASASPLPAGY